MSFLTPEDRAGLQDFVFRERMKLYDIKFRSSPAGRKPWVLALAAALALLGLFSLPGRALAAPAFPGEVPVTQPDGTTFGAVGWGDETSHGLETVDGYTIIQDEASGFWVYAVEQNGLLVPASAADGSLLVV